MLMMGCRRTTVTAIAAFAFCLVSSAVANAAVTFVQGSYSDPQTPQTTVAVTYTKAQNAGDLNVVVVGWNDSTATVASVTDKSGTQYTLAVGPTVISGIASQSIYYLKNIAAAAAGANVVTVTFASPANFPDIRILEYSGVDPVNPIDVTAASSGNSTSSNSGTATTTTANDLIIGANLVQTTTTGPGSGFTSRMISSPDADIAEDRLVTTAGSYSAVAPLSPAAPWIMQMVAVRPPTIVDATPPTAPSNLNATAASTTQINLTWTASTDNVGVTNYLVEQCQGTSCSNFSQIGTSTTTSFNNTSLAVGTTYNYRVRATDAAGNLSDYSNVAQAITLSPPSVPANLTAVANNASSIGVSWGVSTGATGYTLQRCQGAGCSNFATIVSQAGTTYTDTNLAAGTSYSYRVQATNANGASAFSGTATAVTQTPPTAPGSLTPSVISTSEIDLTWTASTSTVGLANYIVQRCQGSGCTNYTQIASFPATTTSYNDTGLAASTSYSYRVQASDTSGNLSALSNVVSATTQGPPSTPTNLTATAASAGKINLSWNASSSSAGLANYIVQRCQGAGCTSFSQIGTPTGTSFGDTGLTQGTTYVYQVQAKDVNGNLSGLSNSASATTQTPPTAPTNVNASATSAVQITVTWTASSSTVGLANYIVQRCTGAGCTNFAQVGTPTATTFNDSGLSGNTTYNYQVQAVDTSGNLSAFSGVATATTQTPQPPSAPGNLTASAAGTTQINLSWTASTSNVGLANYFVQRCQGTGCTNFVQVASPTATNYNDTGLTPGTSYSYQVQGVDKSLVAGPFSNIASATTQSSTGLVVAYAMNEGSGTTTADLSGNGITGALQGATWTSAGEYGNALSFNGSTSYVDLGSPAALKTTGSMTWEAWVFPVANPPDDGQIIAFSNNTGWQLKTSPDTGPRTFGVAVSATSGRTQRYSKTVLTLNTWYHVAGVYNATARTLDIYVNGVLDDGTLRGTVPAAQVLPTGINVNIGRRTGGFYFNGRIDEVRVYNRALSAAEIQADMNTPLAPSNNPPSAPTNLTATGASNSQINLGWSASSSTVGIANYIVQRCQGASCTNFTSVSTPTGTSFNDTGLSPSTTYVYQVLAKDTAGGISAPSNSATATTAGGITPPTPPSNVTASTVNSSQISVSWTASSSTVGISNYVVQRCQGAGCTNFAQVATPTSTAFSDLGLSPNTTYLYQVLAIDTSGVPSSPSNSATATTSGGSSSPIVFVQGNYSDPQSPQTAVPITFTSPQGAGDLNVVIIGWNDSKASIASVNDSNGNSYSVAAAPISISNVESQAIYYANNIAAAMAGSNVVTVTFTTAAAFPDIRILEYTGIDTANPLDGSSSLSGNSAMSSSGNVTTTNPSDLLVAGNTVQTVTTGPGAGYSGRLLTSPDGDIAEDQIVSSVGTYLATAPLGSGQWIMQVAAFKAAPAVADNTPPTTPTNLLANAASGTEIDLSWTASTDNVAVAGYLVESCQGAGCTSFTQIGTTFAPGFNSTALATNATYSYRVRATDAAGNLSPYSNVVTATTPGFTVSPKTATLTPILTQQFSATTSGITWSVDGVPGGNATSGAITPAGLYTPPSAPGAHTVTGTSPSQQSVNATVYVSNYPGTFTRDIDKLRTGLNPNEIVLTPANVNSNQFGKLFSYPLDGTADASPLYVASVNIPGSGLHNVVYVATEHDSVYAFDADGRQAAPLWRRSFINPANGINPVPPGDTGECCDISPEIGITGTPVIDPSTNTLFVVVKTKEVTTSTNYFHRLHALDLATGAEKLGGPIVISATAAGNGAGSSGGQIAFQSLRENQRSALLLNNGVVYIAFGGHGDTSPYHGWILGYDATTLQQVMSFITSPNDNGVRVTGGGQGSGVWQSGDGLATDSAGNLYFVTGNGIFDVNTGGKDYGDSFLKLSPAGQVLDYFTPHDQQNMNDQDLDLGSGGVLLLPDQPGPHPHMAITAGKNGTIYVIDRDNLGHYNANNDNQVIQTIVNIFPNGTKSTGNFKAGQYWNGRIFFSADADNLKCFTITNGLLSSGPASTSSLFMNYPGATLGISSNALTNPILWAIERVDLDPNGGGIRGPGVLHALDATDLTRPELYNSNQAGNSRDKLDFTAKWSAPLVANGKVYVATNGQLAVFGLLPN